MYLIPNNPLLLAECSCSCVRSPSVSARGGSMSAEELLHSLDKAWSALLWELCAPSPPRLALISLSLTHVHLCVSDMWLMQDPGLLILKGKERHPAPVRWGGGMLHAHRRKEVYRSTMCIATRSQWAAVCAQLWWSVFWRMHMSVFWLTHGVRAQGKAHRCNVPGCVCHRLALEDGRLGRTAVQLYRTTRR